MAEPKRDESKLPHVWISVEALEFFTSEKARSVNVAWIDSHGGIRGTREYVPASELEAAQARIREVETLFGNDTSWPLHDVLARLADGADHLLKDHSCDAHGYEELGCARDAARRIVESLLAKEPSDA